MYNAGNFAWPRTILYLYVLDFKRDNRITPAKGKGLILAGHSYILKSMQAISKEDIIQRIQIENPWWQGKSSDATPAKPRAYFRLFYPLIQERTIRRAVVLMGPRRVGKTVMIHHAVQELLKEGVSPRSICYLSVDHPIYNGLSLEKLLDYYGQASGVDYQSQPTYIFFDEIQYLRNWEIHLKAAMDTYVQPKFVVSGSAAAALKLKSVESGAGRFTEFLLPPLTFYEYLDLLDQTQIFEAPKSPDEFDPTIFFAPDIEKANEQFLKYINLGGYPEVIFSPQIQADPGRFIKSDIIDKVLLRDLPSLYGISDIQELNHLFTTLAFNTANEVSPSELSQNSGVTKKTITKYIEYLEAAFLIKTVHRVDHNSKRFSRANFFKVYLTNPSMRAALFAPLQAEDEKIGFLAETAIFSQWFHSNTDLYYARWKEGEVDIVHLGQDQKPQWAVEVKWSDRHCDNPNLLKGLVGFCRTNGLHDVLVTSRTQTRNLKVDDVRIKIVPASVYCYTVGHNVVSNLQKTNPTFRNLTAPSKA